MMANEDDNDGEISQKLAFCATRLAAAKTNDENRNLRQLRGIRTSLEGIRGGGGGCQRGVRVWVSAGR